MTITRKALHRRSFLRGMGAAVGLPFLDAMVPAMAWRRRGPPAAAAHGVRLCAQRHHHGALEPRLRRQAGRTAAHPEAPGAAPRRHPACSAT